MRLVAVLATACTVAVLGAVPAATAKSLPKPVCNLVPDDAGDARYGLDNANIPSDDSMDILGADFASNAKAVTAIIKVKKYANPNPTSPMGQMYYFSWSVAGTSDTLTLAAGIYPTGTQYIFGYEATDPTTNVTTSYTGGEARGSIDGNTIRISADIAKFPQAKYLKPGRKASALAANTRHVVGQRVVPSQSVGPSPRLPLGGVTLTYDDAAGKSYILGTRSCVTVK